MDNELAEIETEGTGETMICAVLVDEHPNEFIPVTV
jgi:hypothetical protein